MLPWYPGRGRSEPLLILGNGTKAGMLRPVQAARSLSTRNLTGITLYSPNELIISARAGTPLTEIEARWPSDGQHIIAEPPDLAAIYGARGQQTLGGVIATNLSGPRRDRLGRDARSRARRPRGDRHGEAIHSGGRVLKNVTGLDLCKLLTGSHGTLGVITEVTLKVLPAPEAVGTLVLPGLDASAGVAALSAALGSPYSVSAAAWLPAEAAARVPELAGFGRSVALARIEDFAPSVAYRTARLRDDLERAPLRDPGRYGIAQRVACDRAIWRRWRRIRLTRSGGFRCAHRPDRSCCGRCRTRSVRRPISTGAAAWSGSPHRRPRPPTRRWRRRRPPPAVPGC